MAQHRSRHVQPPGGPEKAFGRTLREVRKERKLSQEQLALESGFDRTYISLLERGVQSPTLRTLVKLAKLLKVKPSQMVKRMEDYLAEEETQGQGKKSKKASP